MQRSDRGSGAGRRSVVGVMCVVLLALGSMAPAAVIHVPGDFPTIQAAIESARDGDELIVAPGTYQEHIDFRGKSIVVRNIDPLNPWFVDRTVIAAAEKARPVVTIHGGEPRSSVLDGFTITDGSNPDGGGLSCVGSGPTIAHCVFVNNEA